MTSQLPDSRAATPVDHEVVVTGPGVDPRRRWVYLGIAVLVFMLVVFGLARWGAERGNHVRFGFPEKVEGLALTKPDRTPEARDKEILTHYDQQGGGRATTVVEWLPHATREEALDATVGGEKVTCVEAPEPRCAARVNDGVVRVTRSAGDVREVREFLVMFLAERVPPGRRR